jgi:site-specific recombinase XerD
MSEIENIREQESEFLGLLKSQGKSFNTIKNYRTDLECFNQFLMDKQNNLKLVDFNQAKVQEYHSFIQGKYNSDNSKRRRIQALRLFFDYLVNQKLIGENPIRKIPVSPKILEAPTPTPLLDVTKLYCYLNDAIASTDGLARLLNLRNMFLFHLIYGGWIKKFLILLHLKKSIFLKMKNGFSCLSPNILKRDAYTIPFMKEFNQFYPIFTDALERQKNSQSMEFSQLLFNANPYRILSGGLSPRGIELTFQDLRGRLNIHLTPKSLRQSAIFRWMNEETAHATIKEWMGVTPSYSLTPYVKLLKENQNQFYFVTPSNFPMQ